MSTCTIKRPASKASRLTASTVAAAAIERWQLADAIVTRYIERERLIYIPHYFELEPIQAGGEWYALSIKRDSRASFEIIARRRTLVELLSMIN